MDTIIAILLTSLVGTVAFYIYDKVRHNRVRGWKVGDTVRVAGSDGTDRPLRLLAWTLDHVYVSIEDKTVKTEMKSVIENSSERTRREYEECARVMKTKPGFSPDETLGEAECIDTFCGKVIDLMTQRECEAHLKMAMDSENYEAAAKIKRRMDRLKAERK